MTDGPLVDPTEFPPGHGEPDQRREDLDNVYPDIAPVWSLICNDDECCHQFYGRRWQACPKCVERHETETGGYLDPPPEWDGEADTHDEPSTDLINWQEFWAHDHGEEEWLIEPLLPAKRSCSLFAPGGTGKSLLSLWMAVSAAVGGEILGQHCKPVNVLYLDYEMTADDLAERLENMGYGPHSDLSHLHYALLPSLPGLDQPEGGKAVVDLARSVDADLVIVDTFGRAVHGDENDADTVRSWYRWTGLHLKAEGRAFVRVDHSGKDITKGQRGTSAKNDDVDVVWQLTAKDGDVFRMSSKIKRRMSWVPLEVDLQRIEDSRGLRYELADGPSYPAGTKDAVHLLNRLGLPPDVGRRVARQALSDAGEKIRTSVLASAIKYRKREFERLELDVIPPPEPVDRPVGKRVPDDRGHTNGHPTGTRLGTHPQTGHLPGGTRLGTHGDTPPDASGDTCVYPVGDTRDPACPEDPTKSDDDIPF